MYENIKNIIPHNFLKRNEGFIRKMIYIFYKGNKKECPICQKKLRRFVHLKNGDILCPNCGSLARHRRLWVLIEPLLTPGSSVLDISPPRCFYKKLKSFRNIDYTPTDFEGEFIADLKLDLTNANLSSNKFDIIICYHVLEHIANDQDAMNELYRILKLPGKCFIQTPFKEGHIFEDPSIKTSQKRKIHFGQEDHVRIYSVDGLKSRLEKAGFKIELLSFSNEADNYFGFSPSEKIILATK